MFANFYRATWVFGNLLLALLPLPSEASMTAAQRFLMIANSTVVPACAAPIVYLTPQSGSFQVPAGCTSATFEVWGAGGGGTATTNAEAGGGGGAYSAVTRTVTAGETIYYNVPNGGTSGNSGGDAWINRINEAPAVLTTGTFGGSSSGMVTKARAQTVTIGGNTMSIKKVAANMFRTSGATSGTISCEIRQGTHSGTLIATSDALDFSAFPTSNATQVFTFTTPVTLSANTVYAIIFNRSETTSDDINIMAPLPSSDYLGGEPYYRNNWGGAWVAATVSHDIPLRLVPALPLAKGGGSGASTAAGAGGLASDGFGDTVYSGGAGGAGQAQGGARAGGSGGSSAGTGANGNDGTQGGIGSSNTPGGTTNAPSGGGAGGAGGVNTANGSDGAQPGGGGGGGGNSAGSNGGTGGAGKVVITFQ